MIILRNAYYTIDTTFAGKRPLEELQQACYVYKTKFKVDITRRYYIEGGTEHYYCELSKRGKVILKSNNLEDFCEQIDAMGLQLGNHEGEGVTLSELGEQERCLLSSIPYLFSESGKV